MALSNTFKEPRREMTETIIGVVVVGGAIIADYSFANWLASGIPNWADRIACIVLGIIFTPVAVVLMIALLAAAHAIGDAICNRLAELGADPRPTQRYL